MGVMLMQEEEGRFADDLWGKDCGFCHLNCMFAQMRGCATRNKREIAYTVMVIVILRVAIAYSQRLLRRDLVIEAWTQA